MSIEHAPNEGFLRLKEVLQIIPVSKSHWYDGISKGRYPKPIKLSSRINAWRKADIAELVKQISEEG